MRLVEKKGLRLVKRIWMAAGLAAVVWAIAVAPPVAAQSDEELLRELDRLQQRIEEIRALIAARPPAEEGSEALGEAAAEPPGELPEPPVEAAAAAPPPPVQGAPAEGGWEAGYKGNGAGFFLRSPDGELEFRQLGYVQFVGSLFHDDFERADAPGDFSIRRARVDWLVDYRDRYQLFVEFDGGPGSTPGTSDFALVEGKLTVDMRRDGRLQFVGGKYVSPFSSENLLSSRSLDTVERYIALNSMFLLPALDVQFGAMVRGYPVADKTVEVMLGVFNGNGRANDNLSDDNGDKEVQLKVNWRPQPAWKLGLGFDRSREEAQSLQLRGLSFTPFVSVPVAGTRRGATADFAWSRGAWSARGEGLWFEFPDSTAELGGGFLQAGRFLSGDALAGWQLLTRLETARITDDRVRLDGDRIDAVTLGVNWFRGGGTFRLQLDAVAERYNGLTNLPAGESRVEGDGWKPYLLSMMQVKF